jgi:MoaA/NifB/PqqE/SkfB family radical SAM enzyme
MNPQINTIDFNERPFIAIWEVTQARDLACVHCGASAQPDRNPMELSTDEGKILIDQIAALKVPVFVLTGGDPIKRPDLFELIGHARSAGVRVSLTPSATPLLTREVVVRLKEAGLARLAVSMGGASAETHDAFRGMSGSFARTLDAVRWANEVGLPVLETVFALEWKTIIGAAGIEDKQWRSRLAQNPIAVSTILLGCSKTATGGSRASSAFSAWWLGAPGGEASQAKSAMR